VARLPTSRRAALPDSAFADVERRRLPINDESHVRNALARFNQVRFDDEDARSRARTRLLRAAKRYGIVPVGFLDGQLASERMIGEQEARKPAVLPTGFVTMLMTDVEGSTALVRRLGDRYGAVLDDVREVLDTAAVATGGSVVETRADEFFAVFAEPHRGVEAAVEMQRRLAALRWADSVEVRVRIGMHTGEPTPTEGNYLGLPVHTAARISAIAHGGQVLVSADTRTAARAAGLAGVRFTGLGDVRLRGLPDPVAVYQLAAKGLRAKFPPLRF
jgi:class 3 adenylate cyclase